jgi:hypothetical protein
MVTLNLDNYVSTSHANRLPPCPTRGMLVMQQLQPSCSKPQLRCLVPPMLLTAMSFFPLLRPCIMMELVSLHITSTHNVNKMNKNQTV